MRVIATGILALMLAAPAARADGDPASDVLLGENVFYPYMPPVSAAIQKQLDAETAAASRARYPIKVALIASRVDLGVITSLFGRPQKYADFLDQEISYQNRQVLLVVMPSGYGVQGVTPAARAVAASLSKPAGPQSNDLARAAIVAVARLAGAAGHPLKGVSGGGQSTTGTGGGSTTLLVTVLAVAAVAAAAALVVIRRRQATAG
ncbi:MAG: hypothetical protein DLM64_07330 [Solirubrobacterales bacterium]|nr:MAG: hypothetical protein DLM64_07330 [Solirubrobacterales bacterium]